MHNEVSEQQVFSLKHQVVRDLAWSLWGPALFIHPSPHNEKTGLFQLDWSWLKSLDQNPNSLNNYLASKNTRLLGTRFEALWHFYFSNHPSISHSCFNLQVSDKKITIGEFDALIQNENKQLYHIELACKFYLEWSDSQDKTLWIGPNCSDRLDIKYTKTCNHQLPLLHTELGKKAYQEAIEKVTIDKPTSISQLAIWRGFRFNKSHWFRYGSLSLNELIQTSELSDKKSMWFMADKSYWLSPTVFENSTLLSSAAQIKQSIDDHFKTKAFAFILVKLDYSGKNRQWQQSNRYFITPPTWPHGKLSDSALTPLRPCKPPL
jgi:hypothetical protein